MNHDIEPVPSLELDRAPAPGEEAAAAYLRAKARMDAYPASDDAAYLRQHSTQFVLVALVVGFALGRLVGR